MLCPASEDTFSPWSRWVGQGCASLATSCHRALQLGASCLPARAAALGAHPAAGTAPACATNRGEPNQGDFSAQPSPATGSHVPTETATLVAWDVSWSPHHLLLCEGRSGREVPQQPTCAPLGNRRSRKSTLRAPGEANRLLHCCFPVHRRSPAQSAEEGI